MQIRNFGANVTFQPESHFAPKSEEEVLAILGECRGRRIRVVGRLHSWSEAPRGDEVVLDLRNLNAVEIEKRDSGTWATIQSGCQIKKAVAELDRRAGVTLPSLGLIDEQTIAGAVSTGTHGSGKHSLSHYVDEVSVATYDATTGEPAIRKIDGGAELLGARCSIGCMGVILSIGMKCRDQYRVEEHFRIYDRLEVALAAEEDFPIQQFFLVPYLWKFLAQHRREVEGRGSLLAPVYHLYWFLTIDLGLHVALTTLIRIVRSRKLIRMFYRRIVPWTIPRGWKVADKSQAMLTMQHELFTHIEIEVFVERPQLADALGFIRELLQYCDGDSTAIKDATWKCLEEHGLSDLVRAMLDCYTHHYPICVRKVLPDATLISMASGDDEPYYALSFISYDRPRERDAFFRFANVLTQTMAHLFGARPHWGKVCQIDSQMAEQLYPRLSEYRRVCDLIDRKGVFRNPWLEDVIFNRN